MKKVYVDEWKKYTDVFERLISQKQVISMVKRLKKHFDISPTQINFDKYHNASASTWNLRFPSKDKISMGMVAHEVAHQLAWKKYHDNCRHTKKYQKCMKMIVNYVRKRDYWKEVYKDTTIDPDYRNKADAWEAGYKIERSIKKERKELRRADREEQMNNTVFINEVNDND